MKTPPNREFLEETYMGMKENILKSKILLTKRWSFMDEERLNYIVESSINITLKPNEEVTEDEHHIMKVFMALTLDAMNTMIKSDEGLTDRLYDSFVSGDMNTLSETQIKYMGNIIKNGLLSHEQYEKIKNIDERNK